MSGYIGTQPVPQATQTRDSFTATSGQVSFSCSGYTPNFIDVFLNGVKLAAADYTATNGSDVVLASGAATGDILEVVAYTTFTVGSSFTPSIDDNGNATAITIDSSENVMVGTTNSNIGSSSTEEGIVLNSASTIAATRSGNVSAVFNRLTTDGDIISLRKNGSTIGTIGVIDSNNTYFHGASGHGGIAYGTNSIIPFKEGAYADSAISLGQSNSQFKNLYLSGGIQFDPSAKLGDYEEGDWTPTPNSGSFSASGGKYTKIGRVVTLNFDITVGTGGGSQIILPFSSATTTASAIYTSNQNFAAGRTAFYGVAAGVYMYFRVTGDNVSFATQTLDVGANIHASITYHTT